MTMNLIVTCPRHYEPDAGNEIKYILDTLGDSDSCIQITKLSGILTVDTSLDPVYVVKQIRDMLADQPWCIRYCLRIIPIQKTVDTTLDAIMKAVSEMSKKILNDETYRISVKKRNTDISSKEIISKIADIIDGKVSLDFPDKIVLIEVLGGVAGVSILKSQDMLSVVKAKRSMSDDNDSLFD